MELEHTGVLGCALLTFLSEPVCLKPGTNTLHHMIIVSICVWVVCIRHLLRICIKHLMNQRVRTVSPVVVCVPGCLCM